MVGPDIQYGVVMRLCVCLIFVCVCFLFLCRIIPSNIIQIECLKRLRIATDAKDADQELIRDVLKISIKAIAAGMQNTG